ncbi:FAD-binding and (Fe-S)-binding domain-containing protein [Ruicaihuangia caeni]|uniref:D-lactate dehydrogenase (cytochrome) n=1 Tax=Ruicaihuangia caeni TaxID=3042517 RepID=A0AAW6T9G6_9MICO|nr:FAD-binding and (Fe-S)-binding domain-containing protein [Klugiella sp. YN-L-19]MDI2098678.1 FAD-binding and (Fe-S)-binding domain-containing protein [Klugiella sp. YN-L-19]
MTLAASDPALLDRLEAAAPGRVRSRATDRLALAHDASHYLLTPQAVVSASTIEEVARLLSEATADAPITFRSGGTSLSGQAVTDGVLIDTRRYFRRIEVLDEGRRVRVQPGATVRQANAWLARHGRKLGPDPASEAACTIGGVIANNSSGMACGIRDNAYRTLESATLVLPSGTVIDTSRPDADEQLREQEPELYRGLLGIRETLLGDRALAESVRTQFARKNTMGYGLNAFLDHETPAQMLAHVVVGSEGTLAFVAESTMRTIPLLPHAATGLLYFDDLESATSALPALIEAGFATIELLDAASLRVAQLDTLAEEGLRGFTVADHAALLVEFQAATDGELDALVAAGQPVLDALPLTVPARLTRDASARAALWHIRKGLYAAVAGSRPQGTTALLEDIAVPPEALARTCRELSVLFDRHGYRDSVIFGHAKDGNIHFMLTERFGDDEGLDRYLAFTDELVALVLAEGGTLKAEHGTGRMMAPFVREQFGDELYALMVELKRLCDPRGVLNPGVIITEHADAHVRDLKSALPVEEEVDRCVECGYCEPVCPSRDLTLTPRQRIVLRRELAAAEHRGDERLVRQLEREYEYDGEQTCAADGMCQTACPVAIDTGALVKRLRAERVGRLEQAAWSGAAHRWGGVARAGSAALTVADRMPEPLVTGASRAARSVLGAERVPEYRRPMPAGGPRRSALQAEKPVAVFFAACIGTMFGAEQGSDGERGMGSAGALIELCERAGVPVRVPDAIEGLCCGTPWRSKGFTRGFESMRKRVLDALFEATEGGALPVVCDASSCTEGLMAMIASDAAGPPVAEHPANDGAGGENSLAGGASGLNVVDAVSFVAEHVLPKLEATSPIASMVVHPTCSSHRLGTTASTVAIATRIADEVEVPADWGCCGFAGDRGLLHPELTAAATAPEAATVAAQDFEAYASSNRTCELGMTRATGRPYRHVLELLEESTRTVDARVDAATVATLSASATPSAAPDVAGDGVRPAQGPVRPIRTDRGR